MPFENDTAADFAGDLDDASEGERLRLLAEALSDVAEGIGYVDARRAEIAVAAAAVVAGGDEFGSEIYGPQVEVGSTAELVVLAGRAVDRLLVGHNDLSVEPDGLEWTANLRRLGEVLGGEQKGGEQR
ncbi:DUF4259 domain-containing protein [Kribbella sp. NPDC051770]|uniref:DUF4259 domain-containing protein n=1 Tax=Kribbella sp. NPDC051770 TaxID=3155413 RepID=UPI0034272DB6